MSCFCQNFTLSVIKKLEINCGIQISTHTVVTFPTKLFQLLTLPNFFPSFLFFSLLHQKQGLPAVRTFIQTRFLSRLPTTLTSTNPTASSSHSIISSSSPTPSLAPFLKFSNPKRVLSSTCEKYGKERPQSRLLAETGRLSYSPLFVVGVYSGEVKLGEGNGSSIRMAEFRVSFWKASGGRFG